MASYLLRRLWHMVPTLLGVVLLVFVLFKGFGGDPAEILSGQNATAEQIAAVRQQLGLDQPAWVQLGLYLKQVLSFDWGHSWATHEPVAQLFASRLPATLSVMVPILVLDTLIAVPIALFVAVRRGSLTDRLVMVIGTVALSVSFLVYVIVGQYLFAYQLGWFAVQGWSDSLATNLWRYVPLPVLLAVVASLAPQTRLYRSFVIEALSADQVRTARAQGRKERQVLTRHVLRNAWIPVLTNLGLALPGVFVGSFLIESYYSIPGLGREVLLAVNRSDYPVIQATAVYLAVLTLFINLLVDALFRWVDPRVVLK